MLQRALNNRVSLDYIPLQQHEAIRFMRRLAEKPEDFMAHVHLMAASIAIRIAYGYKVDSADDRFVQVAEELMAAFSDVSAPATWSVNVLPMLRFLPTWFPFISFHKRVQEVRRMDEIAENEPFQFVQEQMAKGIAEDSFTSKLLQPEDGQLVEEDSKQLIKSLASTLYGAGSDTTVSGVQSFFLAMTLYPDVQEKAQAEIVAYMEQRLANDNPSKMILPADRPNLPYTSALVRELLRWHPILSVVAHKSSTKDDYNVVSGGKAYRIPAESLVVANVWKIMHDPEVYPEPDRFKPERFLVDNPPPEPESYAFGFGRRLCPGIHIAQQSMWISISNTLANFNITKAKDENGKYITPEERYTSGLIR
ncbi:cytochrome P450 family protein [Ceratobasidium sp. AG-Ba]|nr:cytochrome P450 family protein [Ceratobasidium sp. AG-Ba]